MKKLILSAALVLGSLTSFASTPIVGSNPVTINVVQDDYKEVKLEEVPEAVKAALKKAYSTATLDKAFINEAKEYKLEITLNGEKGNLYADATGKWIEKK